MNKEKENKERRLKLLEDYICDEGIIPPEDLEKRADSYEKYKVNVAKRVGYHSCDISIYTNPTRYIGLVLEALVIMPSRGEGSLIGREELKKFLQESVESEGINSDDAEIIKKKYLHYKRNYRRSDKTIDAHSQLIKLFLNDRFQKLYEKSFKEEKEELKE